MLADPLERVSTVYAHSFCNPEQRVNCFTFGDPETDPPMDSLADESGVFFLASFKAAFVPELRAELINCITIGGAVSRMGRIKKTKDNERQNVKFSQVMVV